MDFYAKLNSKAAEERLASETQSKRMQQQETKLTD